MADGSTASKRCAPGTAGQGGADHPVERRYARKLADGARPADRPRKAVDHQTRAQADATSNQRQAATETALPVSGHKNHPGSDRGHGVIRLPAVTPEVKGRVAGAEQWLSCAGWASRGLARSGVQTCKVAGRAIPWPAGPGMPQDPTPAEGGLLQPRARRSLGRRNPQRGHHRLDELPDGPLTANGCRQADRRLQKGPSDMQAEGVTGASETTSLRTFAWRSSISPAAVAAGIHNMTRQGAARRASTCAMPGRTAGPACAGGSTQPGTQVGSSQSCLRRLRLRRGQLSLGSNKKRTTEDLCPSSREAQKRSACGDAA